MPKVAAENLELAQLTLEKKINALDALGKLILKDPNEFGEAIFQSSLHNKWFDIDHLHYALRSIAKHFLSKELLQSWVKPYNIGEGSAPRKVGIIMAGNVPLAGFHDLLCTWMAGNIALIKLSHKDRILLPALLDKLCELEPGFRSTFQYVEMLKEFDAAIATGGNSSAAHFEYYLKKYPHIIRKNRNSVAVLTGDETPEQLNALGNDIFLYFGLGCRSVSKLYVPQGYYFNGLFEALYPHHEIFQHAGYGHNYDYVLTVYLMNKVQYYSSGFLLLSEDKRLYSPISSLHFEYYDTLENVQALIESQKDDIQCVVANCGIPGEIPFGTSQEPKLDDYADGVDTLQWQMGL